MRISFFVTILALLVVVVQSIPFGHFNPYGMLGGMIGAGGAIGGLVGGGLAGSGQNVFFLNKYRQKKLYHHEIDHQHQSGLMGSKFLGGGALTGALGGGGALGAGLSGGGGALNGNYVGGYHRSLGNVAYDDVGGGYGGNPYAGYPAMGSFSGYREPTMGNGNMMIRGGPYQTDHRQRYTDS